LGGGVVLHALAVRTNISVEIFELVKIWTITEEIDNEGANVRESIESSVAEN
jgi:hypothetical protein